METKFSVNVNVSENCPTQDVCSITKMLPDLINVAYGDRKTKSLIKKSVGIDFEFQDSDKPNQFEIYVKVKESEEKYFPDALVLEYLP